MEMERMWFCLFVCVVWFDLAWFSPVENLVKTIFEIKKYNNQQKKKRKQNITRDIEIKNNVTIAEESGVGIVGKGIYRS